MLELEAQLARTRRKAEALERELAETRQELDSARRKLRGELVPYRRGEVVPVRHARQPGL